MRGKDGHPEYKKHQSYGTIVLTRAQGGKRRLFGSAVEHNHTVHLSIHEAEVSDEHFGHSFLHASSRALIDIEMTEAQFAAFICSWSQGSGTPVTIRRRMDGKLFSVDEPPAEKTLKESFEGVVSDAEHELRRRVEESIETVRTLTKGKVGKKAEAEIEMALRVLKDTTAGTITYGVKSMNEVREKITSRMKVEIEGLLNSALRSAGAAALVGKVQGMLPSGVFDDDQPDDEFQKKLNP